MSTRLWAPRNRGAPLAVMVRAGRGVLRAPCPGKSARRRCGRGVARHPPPAVPPLTFRSLTADFTGYWALAKHEGMDEFLKAAGFPWVVRKAALKFGGSAVDVCSHSGPLLRVTSLNAKGSWTRSYDVEKEVVQRNAEGTLCKTTSWWEGAGRGKGSGWGCGEWGRGL